MITDQTTWVDLETQHHDETGCVVAAEDRKIVVICGGKTLGVASTLAEALHLGFKKSAMAQFLVRQTGETK